MFLSWLCLVPVANEYLDYHALLSKVDADYQTIDDR